MPLSTLSDGRSPGMKAVFAALAAATLIIPLFMIYLLVYDRQHQSNTARASITQGWGGAQVIDGPVLVIPYWTDETREETQNGQRVTHTERVWRKLVVAPEDARLATTIRPERRHRSIYDAVVYEADNRGGARFVLPANLATLDITPDRLALAKAELRFGVSDARGLTGPRPVVRSGGRPLALETGQGTGIGSAGFHAAIDAGALATAAIAIDYDFVLRGNQSLSLTPRAGDTRWQVRSSWPSPSYQGDFLPGRHVERTGPGDPGFAAEWRIGNLALGRPLAVVEGAARQDGTGDNNFAEVDLVTALDLYDLINRSVKYGFLFIGFTFAALLMFDVIGGASVAAIEYLLVGAALVLFFVLLLAFAEVIGFLAAYAVAASAIVALIGAYSASVLGSWRRAGVMTVLLGGLYAVLYTLLNLEDYALLVGSVLLFVALALVMFLTRRIDWRGAGAGATAA